MYVQQSMDVAHDRIDDRRHPSPRPSSTPVMRWQPVHGEGPGGSFDRMLEAIEAQLAQLSPEHRTQEPLVHAARSALGAALRDVLAAHASLQRLHARLDTVLTAAPECAPPHPSSNTG